MVRWVFLYFLVENDCPKLQNFNTVSSSYTASVPLSSVLSTSDTMKKIRMQRNRNTQPQKETTGEEVAEE
jgi:hypothetical protein